MKRAKTNRSTPSEKASRPAAVRAGVVPTDFHVGLLFVLLFEVGHFITLWVFRRPGTGEPESAGWQYAFGACTVLMAASLVVIWRLGVSRRRWGWILVFSCVWFMLLTGRLVTFFLIADQAVPILLTLVVGQMSFALILPAVAREQRRASRPAAETSWARPA